MNLRFLKDIVCFFLIGGNGDVNVHDDCQVVGDVEVEAREVM